MKEDGKSIPAAWRLWGPAPGRFQVPLQARHAARGAPMRTPESLPCCLRDRLCVF
jgi:hypothetical protein